ncbi:MAG: hypothetical protein U5P10_05585 [Spirochaetia bacterium]|nr:hypothetical protein [Spirochaetia bacterium]
MKKAVVLSAAYVGIYIISLLLISGVILIFIWISNYSPEYQSMHFFEPASQALLAAIAPAVALSLMLVLLLRTRTPARSRDPLGGLIVTLVAIALYMGTALLVLQFFQPGASTEVRHTPFFQQRLVHIEQDLLYTGQIQVSEGDEVSIAPLLKIDMDKTQAPRITYFQKAQADPTRRRITAPDGETILEYSPRTTPFYAFVEPPASLQRISREVEGIAQVIRRSTAKGWIFLLLITAGHVLFLTGSWSIIRSSRWPLLNALIALIVFRGFFFLDTAFHSGVFAEALQVLSLGEYSFLAAPAAFLLLGLLGILWGVVHE